MIDFISQPDRKIEREREREREREKERERERALSPLHPQRQCHLFYTDTLLSLL
jgi:hypothetical protein